MKNIILITSLLFSQMSFAKVLFCKQKIVPVKTEYTMKDGKMSVKYTAESAIKQFRIGDIRGLDGLEVSTKPAPETKDLKAGESVDVEINFVAPEGRSFLVTDIQGNVGSQDKFQSLVIPVGELSESQKKERSKNIKSLPSVNQMKTGTNALESETKYHTMKLPE